MRSDLPKLYNQGDTQVDIQSADFANVINYLKANGLPLPLVIQDDVGMPTGFRYVDTELVWTEPNRPPLKLQAFLVCNAPQRAVTDYDMWRGEPKPRIPEEYKPAPPKPSDPPKPAPVTAKPGPFVYGSLYQALVGDESPDGTKYTDERGSFTKRVVPTPFGNSVYWMKDR